MKLALGTVQFGTAYGAFDNSGSAMPKDEAAACLDLAAAAGVDMLDTARAYGSSESVLGDLEAGSRFKLITKVPPVQGAAGEHVGRSMEESRRLLGVDQVYGLMLHRGTDLLGPDGTEAWKALETLKARGVAGRIGVSTYTPDELEAVIERFPVEIVQAPYSVFDQRLRTSGLLARLANRDIELHVRSVFLQGFALAQPAELKPPLSDYAPLLARFQAMATERGLTPLELALGAVLAVPEISRVVVGVQAPQQLQGILDAAQVRLGDERLESVACDDVRLLNPSLWQVPS